MTERTEGHKRITADGPKSFVAAAGIVAEGKDRSAYRAYLDHMRDCDDCSQSLYQCDKAAALWQAYREARS